MNDIADRIKYLLDTKGLTNSQFAQQIGVAASAVSHFVNKRNKPSLDAIAGIINAFPDVSPDWLLSGVGSPRRESIGSAHTAHGDYDSNLATSKICKPNNDMLTTVNQKKTLCCDDKRDESTKQRVSTDKSTGSEESESIVVGDNIKPATVILLFPDGTFDVFTARKQEL